MIARVASSPAELDAADRLVAELYGAAGLPVTPSPDHPGTVLLALDDDGEATGTLTLVLHDEIAVGGRLAIRGKDGRATWNAWEALVNEALTQLSRRKIRILAAPVRPSLERRWERTLGVVAVFRGSYEAMGGAPAVVMVGSVDAMCQKWDLRA